MKLQDFVLIALLLLLSVATLPAQNSLPNPNNDACWSSLSALRACQLQAYNEAQDYAQRCTSYPEYQCFDYYQPQQKTAANKAAKSDRNSTTASSRARRGESTADSAVQNSSAQ